MDTTKRTTKFFMTINDSVYKKIKRLASKRGITTQEFIRAIIIPEWLDIERNKKTHFKTKNSS